MKNLLFLFFLIPVPAFASGIYNPGSSGTTLPLPPGDTNYVQNKNTLQTGTTFYVSSGTVDTQLTAPVVVGDSVTLRDAANAATLLTMSYSGNPSQNILAFKSGSNVVGSWTDSGNGQLRLGFSKAVGVFDGDVNTSHLISQLGTVFLFSSGGGISWSDSAADPRSGTNTGLVRDSQAVVRVASTFSNANLTSDKGAGAFICGWSDTATNATATGLYLRHNTTGAPANGLGVSMRGQLDSSTTLNRDASEETVSWSNATDASRKGRWMVGVHDSGTSAGSPRAGIQIDTDGNNPYETFTGSVTFQGTGSATRSAVIIASPTVGVYISTGTNGIAGTGTLSGGTATINNTRITTNTFVFLTDQAGGLNVGSLTYSRTAGTSFTVTSTNALDSSTFNWLLIEPIP